MTADPAAVGLDAAALSVICPFHVVWDRDLRTVAAGPALARLRPALAGPDDRLGATLHVATPRDVTGWPALRALAATGRLTVVEAVDDARLRLRGELVAAGEDHVVFFGSLVVGDLGTATALGVSLSDFPPHDGVADLLLMSRAQATAIAEATELTDRLRRLNRELEDRVAERTRSLSRSHDEIATYARELERVTERLHAESRERARVEADLRLAHRLEAVGQLAAGVAHEINTPVQFVGDNLRFLGDALDDVRRVLAAYAGLVDAAGQAGGGLAGPVEQVRAAVAGADLDFLLEEAPRAVRESLEGMDRVTGIVRAMREFAHPDAERRPTDLNRCVTSTLVVARSEYRDCADVVTELAADLPQVLCVTGEINQVLLTLVVNAAQAVAEQVAAGAPRGTITVRTRHLAGPAGGCVEVAIADTGGGIADDVLPRIFDPFFTTKPVGAGTGQGLTMAHAIVSTRHGGRIAVTTTPGAGSEFVVRLPVG